MFPKSIKASEGTIELRSTMGEDYRCWAASSLMQDQNYHILVSCRDLLYPAGENIFSYIAWASPVAGRGPIKLGALGYGKAEFKTRETFSSIFITTEADQNVRQPSGNIVMKGSIQPITFLEKPTTPTPTEEAGAEEEVQEPTQKLTLKQRLSSAFKRAGIVVLLALASLIGLVFVLTRPR